MTHRLERLRQRLFVEGEEGLDAILISRGENLRYLSGFTGSAGYRLPLYRAGEMPGTTLRDFSHQRKAARVVY